MQSYRLPVAIAALALLLPAAARAHAILTASDPASGGTIGAGHRKLDFQYNSRIDHRRSRLILSGPDGSHQVLSINADSATNALDTEADLKPGVYTVRWQALALDGHITRGDVPFTVK